MTEATMKNANWIRKSWTFLTLATLSLPFFMSRLAAQSTSQPAADTYTWSGELVSLDEGARILTVKARVVGDQPMTELPKFKSGDRILLTWSGYDKYADAINHVIRYDATKKTAERFTFPVDFVGFDSAHQYVTFKAPVPADSIGKIKSLKPGEWVTATSPQTKTAESQPIVSIRPYVWSSGTNSN
jgi:hypothetical protein